MKTFLTFSIRISIIFFVLFSSIIFFLGINNNPSPDLQKTSPQDNNKSIDNKIEIISTPSQTQTQTQTQDKFSEVSSHNTSSDCWVSYGGHIYDLTPYFGSHPGGDNTLSRYCGRDMTQGFETKDKNNPQQHSQGAINMLQEFIIQ